MTDTVTDRALVNINGSKVNVEVLSRDEEGQPIEVTLEGMTYWRGDHIPLETDWYVTAPSDPLKLAREILRDNYYDDVRVIADDVRERIKSGELSVRDDVDRFVRESVDGSSRLINASAQLEVLVWSNNAEPNGESLGMAAAEAFLADVYDDLGDIAELLDADDSEDEDEDELLEDEVGAP